MLFPKPKKVISTGEFFFPSEIKVSSAENIKNDVSLVFGKAEDGGNFIISFKENKSLGEISSEAYKISLYEKDGCLFSELEASSRAGLMRALFSLKRMYIKNEFILGEITDRPSFSVRGYIEGFYGTPWKNYERLEMLETMALFGENTHYYAPKDDPYHRNKWRELYPEEKASELKCLVEKAKSLEISFYYCIAPGLSMCYSDEKDFQYLSEKTKQLFSMGIKNFGLLLDDIPADLFYENDKKIYKTAPKAHGELVNKYFSFLKSLSADCCLTVCPTSYRGKGDESELTEFTLAVPAEVKVFFTGSDICSKEITEREAEYFTLSNKHKPLYWDNYPVNDAEMFMEMHMGPIIGREKGLYNYCDGIISNCMEYFNCNKIPLITVASYLWNPEEYDPEDAFNEAVLYTLKKEEREAFVLLADHLRTACLHDENSRIMGEYLSRAAVLRQTGNFPDALLVIEEYTEKIKNAAEELGSFSSEIFTELSRWIKKFSLMSEILSIALEVLKGADKKKLLAEKMEEYNESATVLTSFCFREYIESVLYDEN